MSDCETHEWLKSQLGEQQAERVAEHHGRTPVEMRLARRAAIHDWVLIGFMVAAVILGTVVVLAWRHVDTRAEKTKLREDTANSAVVQALVADKKANDAVATLGNDFAVLATARTDADRRAALATFEADRLKAELARNEADKALAHLQQTTTTTTTRHAAATSTTTARASPTTTTKQGTTTTSTSTSTSTSSTTTTTSRPTITVPCVTVVKRCN